ncbi:MAG: hypothetical protein FJ049_04805 [Cyanobacteria bacterium M_surface_7_m2_037]|nr:hypothetical protein [Cyanobacteria bacterium K_DeepCast_0m_m1_088]MBM5795429.1 hypothetical protein [Cyanobacteria bacterium M_surface_7_m2_037]MBM5820171.1 hypothetical protein [Cyanobacteria bacterium K_DeepCast_150m_m2_101]
MQGPGGRRMADDDADARASQQGLGSLQPSDGSARAHPNRAGQMRRRCAQRQASGARPGCDYREGCVLVAPAAT